MAYNELRTLAFKLKEGVQLRQKFQTLNLPAKSDLLVLAAEHYNRRIDRVSIPITPLNKALRALIPDLIYISSNAGRINRDGYPEMPWLYSETAINPQALSLILNAWVNTEFSRASEAQRNLVLQQIQPENLIWQPNEVNTDEWTVCDNGTADIGKEDKFVLLPHILAARFCKQDVSLQFGTETLRFRRAPLSAGTKGAEIISWEPLKFDDWYWSVFITFTAQTVAFQDFSVIHVDIGVRRWGSKHISYLPGDKETSIYLLTEVPWIEGLQNSTSFQVAPIRRVRLSPQQNDDNPQFGWVWGSKLPEILDRLTLQNQLPTPENIVKEPISALNLQNSPNAALVYRNGINPAHEVQPGLSPGDRRILAEQIANLLESEWEFVDVLPKVAYSSKVPLNPFFPSDTTKKNVKEKELQKQRIQAIYNCIGEKLTVEIWHQNSSTPDTIIQEIRKLLGIPESASFPYKFPDLDFTLVIQSCSLGTLSEKLQLDSNISNIKQRRREAINQRCQQVEEKVPLTSDVTVAFIELDGADGFDNRSEDPKKALRKGFALRKRWTQFLSTDTKKLSHRAKNGFLDLLRQLGIQAEPPKIEVTKIEDKNLKDNELQPQKINYVAIWMIRQYSSTSSDGSKVEVPVMVYMTSDSTEIKAIAPGLGREWLPYREILLRIAEGEIHGYQNPQEAVTKFIKPKLQEVLSLGDTLLLCHAQNFRSAWKWLTNGNITQDNIKFGSEKSIAIQDFNSKLRTVRIRDYQSHETPEWYAQNGDETGFGKGIFRMGERVFASTYNTPKTFKLNRDLSKASTWVSISKKTKEEIINPPSPDAYYWNPGLVELTAACIQPDDNPLIWTIITHELRHLALHHDEPLKFPLQLHLAKLIEEYVSWLSDDLPSENE